MHAACLVVVGKMILTVTDRRLKVK
jgi:hypothetical protein